MERSLKGFRYSGHFWRNLNLLRKLESDKCMVRLASNENRLNLERFMGLSTYRYGHLPNAVNNAGKKIKLVKKKLILFPRLKPNVSTRFINHFYHNDMYIIVFKNAFFYLTSS